jgi:lipopolysaccharide export system protein LptA
MNNPQQIVFIDSRVPDIQDLIDGVQPGDQVFVLDPDRDGVQQIADILAANDFHDLSAISIVSHGLAGEVMLGATTLSEANLASHARALAEIGASLVQGGEIQLFGCDVALGTAGQQFINDLSTFTGGAHIEAATHIVGSTSQGGSWLLDASSANGASAGVTAANPFTSQALADFQGQLAGAADGQLWFVTNLANGGSGGTSDTRFGFVNQDGTSLTTEVSDSAGTPLGGTPADVVIDPAAGLYFMSTNSGPVDFNYGGNLLAGSLYSTAAPTTVFSINSGHSVVSGHTQGLYGEQLAIDTANHIVYLGVGGSNEPNNEGILKFTYNPITGSLTNNGFLITASQTGINGPAGIFDVRDMVLDTANHEIYFVSLIPSSSIGQNQIYAVDVNNPTTATTLFAQSLFPTNFSNGYIVAMTVDAAHGELYFATESQSPNPSSTLNAIWEVSVTGGTPVRVANYPTGTFPTDLAFDPTSRQLIVSNDASNGKDILFLQLDSTGRTVTGTSSVSLGFTDTSHAFAGGLAFDAMPTLATLTSSAGYTENASASTLSPSLTVTDPDSALRSATVAIIGGTFSGDGDQLSAATAGTSITASYNSSTETLTLSGQDTAAHYQQVLRSVAFSSGSDNPTNFGSSTTRTLSWVVNDGLQSISLAGVTTTITLAGVNDPPTLSSVAASASYTEGAAATTLSSAASVSDPDSLNLASATVSITAGKFTNDGDVLAASTAGTSITASYNSTTETLVLSGSDTLAHYRTVLDRVTFSTASDNPTNFASNPTRTLTWVLNDGSGSSNSSTVQTTTLTLTNVNDAPTLSNVASSVAFTEGQAVTLSSAVSVSDLDNLNLAGATVSISGGTFAGDGDLLTTSTTGTHITASYNSTTETLTLTGSDTLANYQAVLDRVSFSSGSNPDDYGSQHTRTITWVLNDGSGSSNLSTATTTTVSITPINDPPVLSSVAATASFTQNGAATTLAPALSASDADNLNLANATVRITAGTFANDGDVLTASTAGTSISVSYNSTTETLLLTGSDTLAHYQTVLDRVTFSSAGSNPTNSGANPTRTVTWQLNDGSASNNTSSVATTTISIASVNAAPTLSNVATSASFTEEGAATTLSPSVTVSDPDNPTLASATVHIAGGTFANDGDVLATDTSGTAITASYNTSTETLTLTGSDTLADYRTVLDRITFAAAGDNPTNFGSNPTRTITWVLNDGSASNSLSTAQTTTVSITNVNDPPTLSSVATTASYTEGAAATTLSGSASVSDPDNINLASATVSIAGGRFTGDGDILATTTTGTSITASYNSSSETLTLTGLDSQAHYQQVLDAVTFSAGDNPTNYGSNPTRTITWVLNDGSGSFNLSTAQTTTLTVTGVNDPPTLSNVSASAAFTEGGAAVTLSGAASVSDPDNLNLASATVSIAGGGFAGDVLAATATGAISVSYDSTNERLTLSGSDTLAHYQSVLDTVTFASTNDNPTDYGSNPTRTLTWVLNDGSGSSNLSTAQTTTVSLTNVNDAPTLAGVTALVSVAPSVAMTLSPTLAVSDPDNLNLASATVSITGGAFIGDGDVLAADTTGTGITASYDSTNERLTLSGSDTLAHYQTVLDTVTFAANSADPSNGGANPTRTISWVANDGSGSNATSTPGTTTVDILTGPAVNPPATVAFTEGQASVALAPSLSVTDPNAANLLSATVAITGGTFANDGDVLAFDTSGTSIAASYDSASETLTLSGSDTLAHYQQVLDTVSFATASHNPTDYGSDPTRTVTWTVVDDSGSTNTTGTSTTTINITAVNDPPTATAAASVGFTEGQTVALSPTLAVADVDNINLLSATVAITGGTFANDGDVLTANTASTSITASYNSATETLILTGSDTVVNYQAVLDSVAFASGSNPDDYGSQQSRTVTWVVDDGSGSSNLSTAATTTVNVTAINDAPTVSVAAGVSFTAGQTVALSPAASVSDPDNLNLTSATVSITAAGVSNGTFTGDGALTGDVLSANTSGTNITASYDSTSETLTLTGSDTLANYQSVLDGVTFASGADPSDTGSAPTRTISWVLNDGAATSTPATTTLSVHLGPAIQVPGTAAFTEGGAASTLAPSVSLSDTSSTTTFVSATVAITGGTFANDGDLLAFDTSGTSISASYNSTSETLTLAGSDTLAHYQQVLDTVSFSTTSHNPTDFGSAPTRTVSWTVVDDSGSGSTGTATTTIDVTAVNDPPTVTAAPSAGFTEGQTIAISPTLAVSDVDSLLLSGATVSIAGGTFANDSDVLSANTSGTAITASYDSTTETLTLSGIDSLADYQAVLDSVTFASGDNPDDYGSQHTRTVTWVLDDGSGSSNLSTAATTTINVTAVNDAPTLSNVATTDAFTVGTTVSVSPSLSVSDPDNLDLASATVSVTGGTFVGDGDVLTATTVGNITASYNSSTETLTLTGSDTLANYQSVLDSVTFSSGANPNNGGANPTRTISWVVNDGSASNNLSTAATTTLDIAHVPPVLSSVAPTASFTQGQTVALSPSLSVSDVDSTTLTGATVSIASGTFAGDGDVLGFNTTGTSISASYNASTETLILSGTDTLAHYRSVLDSVTFSSGSNPTNTGANSTRAITWVVNDGNGSQGLSAAQTTTVSLTPLDAAPTLSHVAASAAFTENGSSVILSPTLSVSDSDSTVLSGATVSISGGIFAGDNDVLTATTVGNITASYDSTTEVLILSGTDTRANYQQVLDSVAFASTGENPTNFGSDPTRTITWVVTDDFSIASAAATTTVNVTGINDAPALALVAPTVSFTEGDTLQLSPSLSVSDADSLDLASATVHISGGFANDGDLLTTSTAGTHITASYNSTTETLILTGNDPLSVYQSVLEHVSFSSGSNPDNFGSNPSRTLTWVLNDGSGSFNLSTTATTTVSITAINDSPVLSNVPGSVGFTEGQQLTLAGNASVADPDNINLASATVSIIDGAFAGDLLSVTTTGTAITASYDSASETLTLTGADTPVHYQQVLDSLTFSSGSDNPDDYGSLPTRTLTWLLDDGSGSNNLSSVTTTTLSITAINDAPTLSSVPVTTSFTESSTPVTVAPSLALTDPDNLTLVGATVSIGNGFAGDGDVLTADTSGTSITASYNSSTETLVLSGIDTPVDYQHVLDSVTFVTASHNPTNYGSNPSRVLTWVADDGSGSNNLSSPQFTTVAITAVNDPPVLASVAASATFTESGAAVTLASGASVSDVDNLTLTATVSIVGGTFAGDGDVLAAVTAGTSITASYDSTTERLTLSGADTLAHYQQVLDGVTFATPSHNPTNYGSDPTRLVTWVLDDGSGSSNLSAVATTTVTIAAINDAPTLSGVTASIGFTENGAAITLSPAASVADVDNLSFAGATVRVTGGGFSGDGDVLAATTAGTSITASYNSATETLVLSGTDTQAHYQSVLDSVAFVTASDNPTNYGSNPARTLTWVLNDGSASNGASTVSTTTVNITAVNDAPTLTSVPGLVAFHINQTVSLAPSLSVFDPDNLTLANATVRITGGTFAGDGDVLAATTTGTSITASYNSSTETLTLTGNDTVAHYQSVLDSVTFSSGSNPGNVDQNPTRTLTWVVNDGAASNNLSTVATTTITISPTVRNDFNADQTSDIVFQDVPAGASGGRGRVVDPLAGTPQVYLVNGTTIASQAMLSNPGTQWHIAGSGDFNHDGKADILWQSSDGTPMIWTMNGTSVATTTTLADPGASWHAVGTGDFNGDGNADILFQNTDGTPLVWIMNGTSVAATATLANPGASWHVIGTGDFNDDGKSDILFQNTDGTPLIWTMNGTSVTGTSTLANPGAAWHAIGTGDFNGDGTSDILFQNTDGTPKISLINNATVSGGAVLANPGAAWHAIGTGDYNGDRKADILFQNTDGTPLIWSMNSTTVTATATLANPGQNWHANTG